MKHKWTVLSSILLCVALVFVLSACGGAKNSPSVSSAGNASAAEKPQKGSITLAAMKKAASDAGYEVSEDYVNWNDNIVDGFSVRYYGDGADITSPVYEMKDEDSAEAYAKEINGEGYQVAFVNGKFLSMASAVEGVIENEGEKTFFENLIFGKELPKATEH